MKNYFRLNLIVMLLALPFIFSACSNDDDNAPVARIAIEERGGVQSDGSLYIANGDSICIDRIKVVPEESVPAAVITLCDYYWDGYFVGPAFSPDFSRKFYVYNQPAGRHYLTIRMLVAMKGYPLSTYVSNIPVVVLSEGESDSDVMPDGTDLFSRIDTSVSAGDGGMRH